MELEINKTLKYLDLSIQRYVDELGLNVYSNPTFTDTIILFNSCHLKENNFAVTRYLISRLNTYQLNTAVKKKEIIYIQNYYKLLNSVALVRERTIYNNSFPLQLIVC